MFPIIVFLSDDTFINFNVYVFYVKKNSSNGFLNIYIFVIAILEFDKLSRT